MDLNTFLKDLISLPGLSAFEGPARERIATTWRDLVDELSTSKLGSLHGLKRGTRADGAPPHRVLIATHMDAIGLMATGVVEGLIRVTEVGGVDDRILPGTLVTVHGRRDLPGVVVQPANPLLPPGKQSAPVPKEYLFVDTGLLPDEVAGLVRPGDPISFAQPPIDLAGETLAGHTLDNRASVVALTACLEELGRMRHSWDVLAVATTQEEETLGGAFTSAFELRPDIAIAVDVTFAKGPGSGDWRTHSLGKGTCIGMGANVHPVLFERFKEIADELDIPYEVDIMPTHSGTDAYAMQVVAEGIPSIVIAIPLRYMHTPVEVVSMKDIQRTGRLLAEFIARLEPDFIEKIRWEDSE